MDYLTTIFPLLFLQASVNGALVGAALWGALSVAQRLWPALALQRSVWLAAQLLSVAALALVLLPQSAQLSLLARVDGSRAAAAPSAPAPATPDALLSDAPAALASDEQGAGADASDWLALARAWLVLYLAGLGVAAARWQRAQRRLRALLDAAHPLCRAQLAAHQAFGPETARRLDRLHVLETEAAVSPMLSGVRQARLLLPAHLRQFSAAQQQMIIAHELTHWRRRDPLWLNVSLVLQALLWFNPLLRKLGSKLSWAQELSCDQQVLAGRAQSERQQYAAALVGQLKMQQSMLALAPQTTLAFGGAHGETLVARVALIRQNGMPALSWLGKATVLGGLGAVLLASVLLQPAFAWRTVTAQPATKAPVAQLAAPIPQAWQAPLASVRVNSFFGVLYGAPAHRHRGIDFGARVGTGVLAAADGTVVVSTDHYDANPNYGSLVVVEHANKMRSLYAHLDSRSVRVGELVRAGQVIALSGASGIVSGPHLHFEVLQDDQPIDPERMLGDLADKGGKHARQARATRAAS